MVMSYYTIANSITSTIRNSHIYRKRTFRSIFSALLIRRHGFSSGKEDLAVIDADSISKVSKEKVLKRVTSRLQAILDFIPSNVTVAGS